MAHFTMPWVSLPPAPHTYGEPNTEEGCCRCGRTTEGFVLFTHWNDGIVCEDCIDKVTQHKYDDAVCEKCEQETDETYVDEFGYVVCPDCFFAEHKQF